MKIFTYLHNSVQTIVFVCFSLFLGSSVYGQDTYSDTLNCSGGTPTFVVDLSMSPDSLWVSDPASRAGSCCTPPDNNCVQFSLTLAEDAVGILFSIPDGCGASPSGSLFYQVDCGPLTSVGSPLCLDGPGPFTITFCKPGHNENCYSIQSIAAPNASDNITITDACLDSLGVTGLDEPTITWTSIFPGEIGDYDYLLDCVAGCDTVVVEAVPGGFYPELIKYQMCGTSIGGCSGTPFCDTVSVSIVPLLSVSIEPEEPTICYGGVGIDLSAIPFGGAEPYTYTWNTGAVTADLYVTEPGSYSVMISDGTGCAIAYDTVEVTEYLEPITANAGEDITMCAVPAPTVSLGGIVTGSTTGEWSGGAGTFSPDITALDALYTPTLDELAAGFVELILTTTDNGMCPGDSDTLMIFFPVFTTEIESVVNNVNCFANATGAIDVVLSGGALPVTFEWNTGDISEDLIGILAGSYDVLLTDANGCTETLDFIVTEPPLLVESATLTNIACFGGVDGSVDLLVEGGTPEYDVVWETGELTEDLTGVAAGIYNFTVTDANECILTGSYTITEPTAVVVTTLPTDVSCYDFSDGAIDMTVSGGVLDYTYLWNTGEVTEDLTGIPAALYLVNVTDGNGCTQLVEILISEPDSLVILDAVTAINCFGESTGIVDITLSGGTPSYTYLWSTGLATEDLSDLASGTYSVEVMDANGCIVNGTYLVSEPTELILDLSGVDIACAGEATGVVDVLATGGSPSYSYSWTTGEITTVIEDLIAGSYGITVTDEHGCVTTANYTLTEPTPLETSIDGTDELCPGSMDGTADLDVSGGVPPYLYEWDLGDLTVSEEDLTGLGEGTYVVLVTDGNGCAASDSVDIDSPIDFDAGPDSTATACTDDGIIILNSYLFATTLGEWTEETASGHFNALTSEFDLVGLAAGTYVFNYIIPVFTPCTDTIATFVVVVNPKPIVNFTADEVMGCAPLAISFTNLADYEGSSCVWDMGDGTMIDDCGPINYHYEYPGDYDVTLTMTTSLGCTNSFTAEGYVHIFDGPTASFTYLPEFPSIQDTEVGFTNTSEDEDTHVWNFGDGSAESSLDNPYHMFPVIGNENYRVRLIVTNDNGCVDTAFQNVFIEDELIYYVPNVFTPDGDDYNNTFKPIMTAGIEVFNYRLLIFDRWGEIVFESQNAEIGWSGTYGGGDLVQDGVYIWQLEFIETKSSKRHRVEGHVTLLK